MKCCVQNCKNDTRKIAKGNVITFHTFPKDPKVRTAWLKALGMPGWHPKDKSVVCSQHFGNEDYDVRELTSLRQLNLDPINMESSLVELDAPAALKVCRMCLAVNVEMSAIDESQLNEFYEKLTGISVSAGDCLPRGVCWECGVRLASVARLRSKALLAHTLFTGLLQRRACITVKDILSCDRSHLTSSLVREARGIDEYVNMEDEVKVETELPIEMDVPDDMDESKAENMEIKVDVNLIKDEDPSNEVFVNSYDDTFDEEDDRALSEVCLKEKRKKKPKAGKKPKKDTPEDCADRYRHSYAARRKGGSEPLDPSLFEVRALSYEEQAAQVAARASSDAYACAPFKCTFCFRGFASRERYQVHCVRHDEKSGAFECFVCKTRLKSSNALRKHLTAQHTHQYRCKGCPFLTNNRGVARDHEKWHAGTKYQCHLCASEFTKITTYLGHVRIKHASDFVCELCGYTFVSAKGIDVHKKKKHRTVDQVTLNGPYCDVCDVKFISEEAHDRHLKLSSRHSSDHDPSRLRNDSQSVSCGSGRARERRTAHADPDHAPAATTQRPVTCEQCGAVLADLRLYAQHFRRLHPDKNRTKYPAMKTPSMCEQCGRIFQSMALLKDHMWVHTGEKRFKCDRCPKSFTQKTNLMFHARSHSAARPTYECPVCGKHFSFYNNRRRHMFIHTGLKPHKCLSCGKAFTTAGEHRAHVDHVHLKKPWPRRARARGDEPWPKRPAPED